MNIRDWIGVFNWSWKGVPKSNCRGEKRVKEGRGTTKRSSGHNCRSEIGWGGCRAGGRTEWRNPLRKSEVLTGDDDAAGYVEREEISIRSRPRFLNHFEGQVLNIFNEGWERGWRRVPDGRPVLEDRMDYGGVEGEESFWRGEGVELTI